MDLVRPLVVCAVSTHSVLVGGINKAATFSPQSWYQKQVKWCLIYQVRASSRAAALVGCSRSVPCSAQYVFCVFGRYRCSRGSMTWPTLSCWTCCPFSRAWVEKTTFVLCYRILEPGSSGTSSLQRAPVADREGHAGRSEPWRTRNRSYAKPETLARTICTKLLNLTTEWTLIYFILNEI